MRSRARRKARWCMLLFTMFNVPIAPGCLRESISALVQPDKSILGYG